MSKFRSTRTSIKNYALLWRSNTKKNVTKNVYHFLEGGERYWKKVIAQELFITSEIASLQRRARPYRDFLFFRFLRSSKRLDLGRLNWSCKLGLHRFENRWKIASHLSFSAVLIFYSFFFSLDLFYAQMHKISIGNWNS